MVEYRFDDAFGVDVRNTRSRSMAPQRSDRHVDLDNASATQKPIALVLTMSGEAFREAVAYPVIVEAWERLKRGSKRRKYEAAFTRAERDKLARYHGRFYKWHLVSGTPERVALAPRTLALLQRAVAFCASV